MSQANPASPHHTSPSVCSNAALELLLIQINSILPKEDQSYRHTIPTSPSPLTAHATIPSSLYEAC
ncbi:MAG: hypothetical protein Q9M19_00725 [Mariprofundaceae bacterium]|nr:hypothetical protein [Mariprofundaceae bacterium]